MLNTQLLVQTVDDTPERVGRSAWFISSLIHFAFLVAISFWTIQVNTSQPDLVVTSFAPEPIELNPINPEEFHFDVTPRDDIGSSALGDLQDEHSWQDQVSLTPEIPSLEVIPNASVGQIRARELIDATTNTDTNFNHRVKGAAGVAVTGSAGAIERLTEEILRSLEQRNSLVVWFFDQSGSLQTQRDDVLKQFRRVYEELGTIDASLAATATRPNTNRVEPPLLTSIVAFGQDVHFITKQPTDDFEEITRAVDRIQTDESGQERVFRAIHQATTRYRKYRTQDRNVLFILFTDEAGDDVEGLDTTVELCRRLAIPVYVVGVPAPFGRRETLVKWIDPDPKYDQSVQWGSVNQGPESYLPERVRLRFSGFREDRTPIDSGFGPFALTRLCYETSGIYFTVHPNRTTDRRVGRRETKAYAAFFSAFFSPDVMRRYRPDYVSGNEYMRRVQQSGTRTALIEAARLSWVEPLDSPRRRFVVRRESSFVRELTEAQKAAARLAPVAYQMVEVLRRGEVDRPREIVPRWQAGFDLAMGRALATLVRAETYNATLAVAKRGLKFVEPASNTWILEPDDSVLVGSRLTREASTAREYLDRVKREHEGTPWAMLADRELKTPMSWRWREGFTKIRSERNRPSTANNRMPTDDKRRKVKPAPKKRPPPKL